MDIDYNRIDRLYIYNKIMNTEQHIFNIIEKFLYRNKVNEDKNYQNIDNIKEEMIKDIIILEKYQEYIKEKYKL